MTNIAQCELLKATILNIILILGINTMGHSIQKLREHYIVLNDLDIIASISIMMTIAKTDHGSDLYYILERWDRALQISGPGTIDLDLDTIIGAVKIEDFLAILEKLRAKVATFDEKIPASELHYRPLNWDIRFNDYPKNLIIDLIDKLEGSVRRAG